MADLDGEAYRELIARGLFDAAMRRDLRRPVA
jgi:hypothetical protein